jgi:hypothetical protein
MVNEMKEDAKLWEKFVKNLIRGGTNEQTWKIKF